MEMAKQGELFVVNAPAVPGLLLVPEAVTAAEEEQLAALPAVERRRLHDLLLRVVGESLPLDRP